MKIAIIGARGITHTYGGIERVLVELCPRLAARGHEVHVFSDKSSMDVALPPGVKSIAVPSLHGKYTETITRSMTALTQAVFGKYDVINFVALGPGILSPIPRFMGVPVVVSIHGLDWARDKWPLPARLALKAAERTVVGSAHQITVVSEQLVRYLQMMYARPSVHTPNGASLAEGEADPHILADYGLTPGNYVLFASRLVKEKGAHELIEAFNRVPTDKKLVIAGGDRYDRSYVASLRRADRTGRCVFTGHVGGSDLDSIFKGAALYVLPSHVEGFSLSLLEALGHGKAILASDIPENAEAVGGAGAYFPVGDVDAMAKLIHSLLRSPETRDRLGAAARQRAQAFYSWDNVADTYLAAYEAAIHDAHRPRIRYIKQNIARYIVSR